MKMSRFSEERIEGVLKEAEAGVPVKELWRRIGISDATFRHWKAKLGGQVTNQSSLSSKLRPWFRMSTFEHSYMKPSLFRYNISVKFYAKVWSRYPED